jgi:hypothetical protein
MGPSLTWLPEHDAILRQNFDKGLPLSYSQIASVINGKFGTRYSRNSAIGRANRLKLVALKKIKREPGSKPIERKPRATSGPKIPPKPVELRCDPVNAGTLHLLELETDMCRYPTGEGADMKFCGRWQVEGKPYCGAHCEISYRNDRRAA